MLTIYNTLTKSKEVFKPLDGNKVRMYVCGMTVYDYCHLGHGRCMVAFDLVTRWLRFSGYDLTYVRIHRRPLEAPGFEAEPDDGRQHQETNGDVQRPV
ncbi:hypothetical protein ACQKP2_12135, partial [Pseudomonas sp. NPDC089569]